MKFHKNKFLTTVSAIALVLAVGACSSSDDDDMALMMNGDGAATNGGDAATNGGDDATNGGDDTKTPAETLADAKDALATLPADATDDARAAAMTALEAALKLEGNEAERLAYLEKKVADQAQAKKDSDAATAAKEASDKAAEVLLALETGMLATTGPIPSVSASSGGDLTAKAAGYTMSSTTPEAISGFRGAILTKDRAEARVYTNIEDAVATLMDGIYSATSDPDKPKTYTVVDDAADNNNVPWTVVKRDDSKDVVDNSGDDPVMTFVGSVSGLAGVFSCSGTLCMAPERTADGSVADGSPGTWQFAPTDPNGKIDVVDKDGYVQFGWWLNMLGKDVEDGFEVQTFASAFGMTPSGELQGGGDDPVTGSATYTGGAAGKWAIASTTEDTTEGGHFTATATLGVNFDAKFGAADADANKDGVSVSGTINNFMTGDMNRPNWKVTLTYDGNADVDGVNPGMNLPEVGITGTEAVAKWETGGAVDGTGTWDASFYVSEKVTTHPTAVVGTFHAAIAEGEVGRIQGAFGATK